MVTNLDRTLKKLGTTNLEKPGKKVFANKNETATVAQTRVFALRTLAAAYTIFFRGKQRQRPRPRQHVRWGDDAIHAVALSHTIAAALQKHNKSDPIDDSARNVVFVYFLISFLGRHGSGFTNIFQLRVWYGCSVRRNAALLGAYIYDSWLFRIVCSVNEPGIRQRISLCLAYYCFERYSLLL